MGPGFQVVAHGLHSKGFAACAALRLSINVRGVVRSSGPIKVCRAAEASSACGRLLLPRRLTLWSRSQSWAPPAHTSSMSIVSLATGRSYGSTSVVVQAEEAGTGAVPAKQLKLGFLGLGIMGTAMARNLLSAGYQVVAWNRSADKCEPLLEAGAKVAGSPREVTECSDITIAMLADPLAAMEVACGAGEAVRGLGPGKGYVDASTVDADTVCAIAAAVRAQGAQYLEAPVSGSKKPAEDGTLIFLTAGDRELYDRAADIFDLLGKYKVFLGPEGNGARMKLVVNMIMGSMMAAFSEGLVLGERAGLEPRDILNVISQGAISSPMLSLKGPSMVAGNFPPAFPLKHQQKDLRLALALGDELAQTLPVAAAANEMYKAARMDGFADNDFSAVIEAYKKPSS